MVNERNRLVAGVKRRAFAAAHRLFSRAGRGRALPAAPARVLVMQLQQIGDSVIFTPTLRALRERLPSSRIDMLVNPVSWEFYKKCRYVDRFHVARTWRAGPGGSRLRPMLPLLRAVRRERYDVVIADLAQSSFKYSLVAWLTGAPVRVGFDVEDRGFLYTHPLPFRPQAKWVSHNLDIAGAFGARSPSAREEQHFDADDVRHVDRLLAEAGIADAAPLVLVHTGTNWQSRTWYEERWATLADALVERAGSSVVFVGSGGEREVVDSVRRRMQHPSLLLAGRTDIPQLAALLHRAQLFVGTDSGPRHMAGAAGTPHVTLMSSQDASDRWVGFRESETLLRTLPGCAGCGLALCGHKTCMDLIRVDDVIDVCMRLLAPARRAAAGLAVR